MLKKISSLFIIGALVVQMMVPVHAEDNVIYKLNLEDHPLGALTECTTGVSDRCTVEVKEDTDGSKYVEVIDKDEAVAAGISHNIEAKSNITVSFDYRGVAGVKHPGLIHISSNGGKFLATITLKKTPYYYDNGKANDTKGDITDGKWTNITIVLKPDQNKFDMYQDGVSIAENIGFRDGNTSDGTVTFALRGNASVESAFDFKNYVEYKGEVVPKPSEDSLARQANPERTLVDYKDSHTRLNNALKGAVAMTIGNSVARVDNSYVNIYPGEPYVAPYISDDGSTLIPARFVTEAIGCTVEVLSLTSFNIHKGSTTIQFNTGDKNAIINGKAVEMPTAPVIKKDRLFVPLRFAAETFGKNVFWDDRGLIVISDGVVVKAEQEEIIKPLITDIRNHATIYGNKKYSDVNVSARFFRADGDGGQWGALDAMKRFMGTVNRWTYVISGEDNKAFSDLGLLTQGSINANVMSEERRALGDKNATSFYLGGDRWMRGDGVNGTTWGCVCNPNYTEDIYERVRNGVDNGIFMWQFDDWAINYNYDLGGCHCNYCNEAFKQYIKENISPEEGAKLGIEDVNNFDYIEYLKSKGILTQNDYGVVNGTPIELLRMDFLKETVREFHTKLLAYMKEYAGYDNYFAINLTDPTIRVGTTEHAWLTDKTTGIMGETKSANTSAAAIFAGKLVTDSIGQELVISPTPRDPGSVQLTHSAIPMSYALGTFVLVPWDTWLYGSTKYFSDLESLEGSYELPREYPYLFDNYEAPERIGYVFDLNENDMIVPYAKKLIDNGIPARGIVRQTGVASHTFDETHFYGLDAVIATGELPNLTEREKVLIENSGVKFIPASDTEAIKSVEESLWMVRTNDSEVSTTLRTNSLYDNAPVVVHAVNYSAVDKENTEIEINNMYLPEGDKLTINVYRPWENPETITVSKGQNTTKVVLDDLNIWAVLEICGNGTVRRGASFDIGDGYNGIGMGTRMSNDKAMGTPENFTIVTYSEGINSATYRDTGSQDEAAFVYKRISNSKLRTSKVQAGFDEHDGVHGVMIRDGIYTNARFVGLVYDEDNGLRLAKRLYTNKAVLYTEIDTDKHNYMKLERKGDNYIALVSDDGENYEEVASVPIYFDAPVAGVFASSPDGSRSECKVHDFFVSNGSYAGGEITRFSIDYEGGKIKEIQNDASLELKMATEEFSNLTVDDLDLTFTSSNENVLKVGARGQLIPVAPGKATVTAVAKSGFKKATDTTQIEVLEVDPVMFAEDFDDNKYPEYMEQVQYEFDARTVEDGVLKARVNETGRSCDIKWSFEQYNMPVVLEFDFKAIFGKESATTGCRVMYANDMTGMALIANPDGFFWFVGNSQEKVMPIEEDRWYHIRIEGNYEDQTASLYIDDKLLVENGQPRGALMANGSMWVGGYRLGTDTSYEWDNFKFYFEK